MSIPSVNRHTPFILQNLILQAQEERSLVSCETCDFQEITAALQNVKMRIQRLMCTKVPYPEKRKLLFDMRRDLQDLWSRHDSSLHESDVFTTYNRLYFDELFAEVPVCSARCIAHQVYTCRNAVRLQLKSPGVNIIISPNSTLNIIKGEGMEGVLHFSQTGGTQFCFEKPFFPCEGILIHKGSSSGSDFSSDDGDGDVLSAIS